MIPCDSLHDKDTLKHANNTLGGQIYHLQLEGGFSFEFVQHDASRGGGGEQGTSSHCVSDSPARR